MVAEKIAARKRSEGAVIREARKRGEAPPLKNGGGRLPHREATALLNVGEDAVTKARTVRQKGTPELIKAVEKGQLTVAKVSQIARQSKTEQAAAVQLRLR